MFRWIGSAFLYCIAWSFMVGCGGPPASNSQSDVRRQLQAAKSDAAVQSAPQSLSSQKGEQNQESVAEQADQPETPVTSKQDAGPAPVATIASGSTAEPTPSPETATPPSEVNIPAADTANVAAALVPSNIHEPHVVMSEEHEQSCLVGVGDEMPELELLDSAGHSKRLGDLLGERLTVVVFWSQHQRLGREQVQRLSREIAQPFAGSGLEVLAVHVGEGAAEKAQELLGSAEPVDFAMLRDHNAEAFAQIGKGQLPRTYLLDENGHVLWLDIEYSRSMMRELINAIYYSLGHRTPSDS